MPLQVLGTSQGMPTVKYTPARDLNHIYPFVIEHVEKMLYEGRNKPLREMLKHMGVTDEDLAEAMVAYCKFINMALDAPDKTVIQCQHDAGLDAAKPGAKIAINFWLGVLMTGNFFQGIRQEIMEGDKPPEIKALMEVADRMQDYANSGWLRRLWLRIKHRWGRTRLRLRYTMHGH